MTKELKDRILAFNRVVKENRHKATDMDLLISALGKLPPGQLKKVLTPEIFTLIEKYGYEGGDNDGD